MKKKLCCLLLVSIASLIIFGCAKDKKVTQSQGTTPNNQEETTTSQNTSIQEDETTSHEHDYEENIIESSCGKNGSITYTCKTCKDSYSEDIPALEHSYNITSTVNATCTTKGSKTFTCSKCANSYNEEISILSHNWKAATCTSAQICNMCGTTNGSALGHNTNTNGRCERCGVQISSPTYDYNISYPKEDIKAYKKVNGIMSNRVMVTNITCTYDSSKNPTLVTIAYTATKQYQGSALSGDTIENVVYISLFDVNGNRIGQKTVVTNLQEDESQACSVYFQIAPGIYTITITGD